MRSTTFPAEAQRRKEKLEEKCKTEMFKTNPSISSSAFLCVFAPLREILCWFYKNDGKSAAAPKPTHKPIPHRINAIVQALLELIFSPA